MTASFHDGGIRIQSNVCAYVMRTDSCRGKRHNGHTETPKPTGLRGNGITQSERASKQASERGGAERYLQLQHHAMYQLLSKSGGNHHSMSRES
jgi:hypothetical protein